MKILVSVLTIYCSVHMHFCSTQLKHYMLRKSNCNRMQQHILIVWPVLSEDVIKHVWYTMVGKSQKDEHNRTWRCGTSVPQITGWKQYSILSFNILQHFNSVKMGRPGSEALPFYYLLCENEVLYHLGALFWNVYPSSGVLNIHKPNKSTNFCSECRINAE